MSRGRKYLLAAVIPLVLLLGASASTTKVYRVPTSSMESTVLDGDHIMVASYSDVKRGDIIVFKLPPNPNSNSLKRVMGVPGDRIKISNKQVFLNGKPLTEPYKQHIHNFTLPYRDSFPDAPADVPQEYLDLVTEMLTHVDKGTGDLVVPAGRYFVLGDNRDNSLDSRYWGWVPSENIIGKPGAILWSYKEKPRWERTFKLIRGYNVQ